MNGSSVYLLLDEFARGKPIDSNQAADYLELSAFFSCSRRVSAHIITDALEIGAETDHDDVDSDMCHREEVTNAAIECMEERGRALGDAYPFSVDESGDTVTVKKKRLTLGQAAYLVSLVLSNLKAVTPLLYKAGIHPSEDEVRALRQFFQYFATAALAAEVGGPAWSFGSPRPDGTGFMVKLKEIWREFQDGVPGSDPAAPAKPQDDQVDVFARRKGNDRLPGFLFAAAQVATGNNWRSKPLRDHVVQVFYTRWFCASRPVTSLIPYHVIPFARSEQEFRGDVLELGNVLHRLRVPRRVSEAELLIAKDIEIEAFDRLEEAVKWVEEYSRRACAT